jgi:hypothetical protein
MGTGVICPKQSGRGVNFNAHFHLALILRMRGDIPLLPLYALMTWTDKYLPLPFFNVAGSILYALMTWTDKYLPLPFFNVAGSIPDGVIEIFH